jgi:hypothetical protein
MTSNLRGGEVSVGSRDNDRIEADRQPPAFRVTAFAAIVNAAMMREQGIKPEQARKGLIFKGY